MNIITQQILEDSKTLPLVLQEEVLDFIHFLKQRKNKSKDNKQKEDEPNGAKMAKLMKEASEKNLFSDIKDPVTWQRKIRKDRSLPGREE